MINSDIIVNVGGFDFQFADGNGRSSMSGITFNPFENMTDPDFKLAFKSAKDMFQNFLIVCECRLEALEKELHARFKHRVFRGEWFLLEPEDIEYLIGLQQ